MTEMAMGIITWLQNVAWTVVIITSLLILSLPWWLYHINDESVGVVIFMTVITLKNDNGMVEIVKL